MRNEFTTSAKSRKLSSDSAQSTSTMDNNGPHSLTEVVEKRSMDYSLNALKANMSLFCDKTFEEKYRALQEENHRLRTVMFYRIQQCQNLGGPTHSSRKIQKARRGAGEGTGSIVVCCQNCGELWATVGEFKFIFTRLCYSMGVTKRWMRQDCRSSPYYRGNV